MLVYWTKSLRACTLKILVYLTSALSNAPVSIVFVMRMLMGECHGIISCKKMKPGIPWHWTGKDNCTMQSHCLLIMLQIMLSYSFWVEISFLRFCYTSGSLDFPVFFHLSIFANNIFLMLAIENQHSMNVLAFSVDNWHRMWFSLIGLRFWVLCYSSNPTLLYGDSMGI